MSDLLAVFLIGLVMFGDKGNSSTMPPHQPAHSSTTTTFNLYRLCHVQANVQCCLILLARKLVGIVHMIQWVLSFELSILVKY